MFEDYVPKSASDVNLRKGDVEQQCISCQHFWANDSSHIGECSLLSISTDETDVCDCYEDLDLTGGIRGKFSE